jgi:hypothetical protein
LKEWVGDREFALGYLTLVDFYLAEYLYFFETYTTVICCLPFMEGIANCLLYSTDMCEVLVHIKTHYPSRLLRNHDW